MTRNRFLQQILGAGIGERTQTFLTGLSWVGSAAILARISTGIATLLVARWMGPALFGQASVVLAATLWIQVPLFLGLPMALMHYIPQQAPDQRPQWASTGMELLGVSIGLTLGACYIFRRILAGGLHVTEPEFVLALLWSGAFAIFTAGTSLLSGLEKFKNKAGIDLLFAFFYPVIIYALKISRHLTPKGYIGALAGGYILAALVALASHVTVRWSRRGFLERGRTLIMYGLISSLGGVVYALIFSPGRLVANRYLSSVEVGILSAYNAGSIQMAYSLLSVVSQVFFPIASRTPNRYVLLRKIGRLMIPGTIAGGLICIVLLRVYFVLLGKHYPVRMSEAAAFGVAASLTLFQGLLLWFLASLGRRGIGVSSLVGLASGTINLVGCLWLIPRLGVIGAGIASSAGSLGGISICFIPQVLRLSGLKPESAYA